jgi:hypothetical protein
LFLLNPNSEKSEKVTIKQVKQALTQSNISYESIQHIEEVETGVLAFYTDMDGLNAGYLFNGSEGLKWNMTVGSVGLDKNKDLSYVKSGIEEIPLYFIYGVVYDPKAKQILVKEMDKDKRTAEIIASDELRMWFVFSDEPINQEYEIIIK